MKKIIFTFREWLANSLVKLAHWIRPKVVSEFMKSLEDAMIYGNGFTRVNPKDIFK